MKNTIKTIGILIIGLMMILGTSCKKDSPNYKEAEIYTLIIDGVYTIAHTDISINSNLQQSVTKLDSSVYETTIPLAYILVNKGDTLQLSNTIQFPLSPNTLTAKILVERNSVAIDTIYFSNQSSFIDSKNYIHINN